MAAAAAAVAGAQPHIEPPTGPGLNPIFTEEPSNSTWFHTMLSYLSYIGLALPIAAVAALCIYLFFQLSLVIAILTVICALAGAVLGAIFLYKWLSDWASNEERQSKIGAEWHGHLKRWKAPDNSQLNEVEKRFFDIPGMREAALGAHRDRYLPLLAWLSFFFNIVAKAKESELAKTDEVAEADRRAERDPNANKERKAHIFEMRVTQWRAALCFNEALRLFFQPRLHTNGFHETVVECARVHPLIGFGLHVATLQGNCNHHPSLFEIRLPGGAVPLNINDFFRAHPETYYTPELRERGTPADLSLALIKRLGEEVEAIRRRLPPAPQQ